MSTDAAPAQTVRLITSDNQDMTVDRQVAERSILIKNLLEDLGGDNDEAIPRRPGDSKRLPGVSGTTPSGSRSVHRMTTFQLLWLALRASCQVCAA